MAERYARGMNGKCTACGNVWPTHELEAAATGWVCKGCLIVGVAQAQAQQLGQQGLESPMAIALRLEMEGQLQQAESNQQKAAAWIQAVNDSICPRCRGEKFYDRDGMLLADRLQVLADENVVLLAENARLRRELERSRKR